MKLYPFRYTLSLFLLFISFKVYPQYAKNDNITAVIDANLGKYIAVDSPSLTVYSTPQEASSTLIPSGFSLITYGWVDYQVPDTSSPKGTKSDIENKPTTEACNNAFSTKVCTTPAYAKMDSFNPPVNGNACEIYCFTQEYSYWSAVGCSSVENCDAIAATTTCPSPYTLQVVYPVVEPPKNGAVSCAKAEYNTKTETKLEEIPSKKADYDAQKAANDALVAEKNTLKDSVAANTTCNAKYGFNCISLPYGECYSSGEIYCSDIACTPEQFAEMYCTPESAQAMVQERNTLSLKSTLTGFCMAKYNAGCKIIVKNKCQNIVDIFCSDRKVCNKMALVTAYCKPN